MMKNRIFRLILAGILVNLFTTAANASLIAYYDFNGNANDVSGNGNHATSIVGVTQVAGKTGQAYDFSGAGQYIDIPVNINPDSLPFLTMGAWVQTDAAGSSGKVISHDDGGFDRTIGLDARGGSTGWSAFTGVGVLGDTPATQGNWQFIAVAYNQNANSVLLYIDGVIQTSAGMVNSGANLTRIGGNPTFGNYFDGRIDDVFFYDEVLSQAALDQIRVNGIPTVVPVPTAAWLFGSGLLGLMSMKRHRGS